MTMVTGGYQVERRRNERVMVCVSCACNDFGMRKFSSVLERVCISLFVGVRDDDSDDNSDDCNDDDWNMSAHVL